MSHVLHSKNPRTCEKCTRFSCNSRMSLGQNLIPRATAKSACQPACPSASLPACLLVHPPAFQPACSSACLPDCPSVCLSVCLPVKVIYLLSAVCLLAFLPVEAICLPVCLSVCLPACQSHLPQNTCLSAYLPACLSKSSICLPICLPAGLPAYLSTGTCLPACECQPAAC